MKYLAYFFLLVTTVVLQIVLEDLISIKGVSPDFCLVAIGFIAMAESRLSTTLLGFVIGFVIDALGSGMWGLNVLTKTVAGFMFGSIFNKLTVHHTFQPAFVIFSVALFHNILLTLVLDVGTAHLGRDLLAYPLPSALYTFVIAQVFFSFLPGSTWRSLVKRRSRIYKEL